VTIAFAGLRNRRKWHRKTGIKAHSNEFWRNDINRSHKENRTIAKCQRHPASSLCGRCAGICYRPYGGRGCATKFPGDDIVCSSHLATRQPNITKIRNVIVNIYDCRKYQFMQANTENRAKGLRDKVPDIQKTLDMVRFLSTRKPGSEPLETTFELNDTLYAKALIEAPEEVYLWLGANVMLAYPIAEAESLLKGKLDTAQSSLDACEEDLDFLREQITVCLSLAIYVLKLTNETSDDGGCHSTSIQLGCSTTQKRKDIWCQRVHRRWQINRAKRLEVCLSSSCAKLYYSLIKQKSFIAYSQSNPPLTAAYCS
jgi:prefoldin subunit 5